MAIKTSVSVQRSGPGVANVKASMDRMKRSEVLVGIPAEKAMRKGDPINNASLMYVLSKGSLIRNIPATPVIEPAIQANAKIIAGPMGRSAAAMLQGRADVAEKQMRMAGTVAANSAKRWFTDPANGWPPNAPATIAAKGTDRRNINTGQLRRAITSVVRFGGR